MGEEAHKFPAAVSAGHQQRAAIARALANDPLILVADEPTGNLDSRTSLEVMALLQDLHREGMTILIVTHESDIAAYAERRLFIKDGRVRSDDRQTPRIAAEDLANWQSE
jgi:putative ABC transport system ATP-binding protein